MPDTGPLLWAAAAALVAALFATPAAWRATRGLPRWPRIVTAAALPVAVAVLLALPGPGDSATVALTYSAIMQAFLLPFLALLPRKA